MLTDLYQLTMAQAYYASGMGDTEGCFHLYFRENPFGGGYSVAAGLAQAIDWLESWRFECQDIDYLREQTGNDGKSLFSEKFLSRLAEVRFSCDVDAVPEGTIVFPREPLLRICGPLPVCQMVETALLTIVNYQTLIATKASRCRLVAGEDTLLEFGLRRAQGPDGGLSASRAAFIGGCDATSNVLAGQQFGIPVAGTHAHSWVMAFDDELDAFSAYADALPNNVTLLVDTYDTLEGVRRAVKVGERLRERGHVLAGVRIDSGDLAWLSVRVRAILDQAGFTETRVVASNELDEYVIDSLKDQGAAIDIWGVGTKLVTGWDNPALGGVYKLSAIRHAGGEWIPRVKVTEQTAKATAPGVQGVRRYRRPDGSLAGDMIYDLSHAPPHEATMVDPVDATHRKTFTESHSAEELLVPVFRGGALVYGLPPLEDIRARAQRELVELDPSLTRFLNPHIYPVGLERCLNDLRIALVLRSRGIEPHETAPSAEAVAEAEAVARRSPLRKE
ncbi:MAG TPA: nicotinate phosphoribosyltransferase [Coriobacteriia bacterium]|nr:nicotinate phosphoribosyltransferase [Coriobacteriia bacterium]